MKTPAKNLVANKTATAMPVAKNEAFQFNVSFDPTNSSSSVEIQLPNGKTVTSKKKEVMKHVTRAVIKACVENNMNKKAASLRPFMKDEVPASPKQDKLREAFLDVPVAKRMKKDKGNANRLTKSGGDVVRKKGNWTNEEDVAILDYAAKFEDVVDWATFTLPSRVQTQCENRYKVLSRKKGDWTKDEDDAILKYGQGGKDVDWSAFVLPGRVAKQCSNRHKKLISGKVDTKWSSWTKEEDAALLKQGEAESALVLSNRTARQCIKRYSYLTSKKSTLCPIKKGGWTKEEDQQILSHGTNVGDKDWMVLADKLPGRVAKQCSNRFHRLSKQSKKHQEVKKGGWTCEEDEKILLHVRNVGQKDWFILAKELPGRLPKQCSNRYNRLSKLSVDCKVGAKDEKKVWKAWTVDEDQIIKDHVKKYGAGKWKIVADQLPGRVPGGCKHRWFKHLSKDGVADGFEMV